jgi:predicted Zn-dependent protease
MADVYETLGAVSGLATSERLPDWMSTHPNPEDRRQRIAQAVAALGPDFAGRTVDRDAYLRRLDGMVYGDDPRQGYFDGTAFLHPALKFRFDGPEGFKGRNLRDLVVLQNQEGDAALQLTLSDKPTPEAAAEAFFARQGLTRGAVGRTQIHGLPAVVGTFGVASDSGQITGEAALIQHDGRVYQLVGFAKSQAWPARKPALQNAIRSFAPLTDAKQLAAKPYTIEVVANDRAQTLAQLNARQPSTIPIERLAVLNHVQPDTRLEAGRLIKRVVGGPEKP